MEKETVNYPVEWKIIEEFPNFEISITAIVRNRFTLKQRKISIGKRGYPVLSFRKGGKLYLRTLHSIFAKAFIPNPDNKPHINHIDGDKYNCSIANLEWVTPKENIIHARSIGLRKSDGDKKVGQFKSGQLLQVFKSASEASRVLKINRSNICNCARGNTKLKTYKDYEWRYL